MHFLLNAYLIRLKNEKNCIFFEEGVFIPTHFKFKLNVIGEPSVGKSAFNKFCGTRFEESVEQLHEQVYGVSFAVKILKTIDIKITLVVWNLTGQERYKTLQPNYMQGASGILLLFDLTRKETFDKLWDWIKFIRQNGTELPIFLLGSKADLYHLKKVRDIDIEKFVNTNNLQGYYEVSFKTGLNVELVIRKMTELIYQTKKMKRTPKIKFKLERPYSDRPLILDEEKILSNYILTLQTIYDMIFEDISDRIKHLEEYLEEIGNEEEKSETKWIQNEVKKINTDINTHNTRIKDLLEDPPIPLKDHLKSKLHDEWNEKRNTLLYRILVFKDIVDFLDKLQ
ncbi:MAG: Rab family GTPase [Promethearchaeota archaeon]